ncbi:nidogen [Euwallacea similis]|uniref:nidogen n=1 Tax=Euwallacea similis TaxID=1736056 RepID=UPI00344F8745
MRFKHVFLFLCSCASVGAISSGLLYEYDTPVSKKLPPEDDVSSEEIQLQVPVVFYGVSYKAIFVNSNGFLSFQTEIPHFINMQFPLEYPIIAPFYSNVDITTAGTIAYYETQDPALLHRATENVHEYFLEYSEFQARSLFIATWNGVGYFNRKANKVNTYQVVLITDGRESFAEFLYPENGIQWIQGSGDESGLPDARAQVGFLSSEGKEHTLPGSATEHVRNLEKWTNMGLPGQFIFKISDEDIVEPDDYERKSNQLYPPTCAEVPTACHSYGTCMNFIEGFCCRCNSGYFGNGKFCVPNGVPLRVGGKVNGKLNGEKLENLDLQSYIVTADGRAYTAISKIPESIGGDVQTLQILGSVIGYLFAQPIRGALNGFSKTGGQVNHSATITFLNTSQVVRTIQKFSGLDVFDHLRVDVEVQGEIPTLAPDTRVLVDEYQEQYTQTGPGLIQMTSDRPYIATAPNGEEMSFVFRVEQTFEFDTCPHENDTIGESWTLKVGKNFINYEARERIVRFGVNNKVTPIGEYDPCIEGRDSCGANSACVVEGSSFSCACNPGYQKIYSGYEQTCVDENECQTNHECDGNAQCYNTIGSYQCSCNPGFEGDGKHCSPLSSCSNVTCNADAECVEVDSVATCRCQSGFRGDGYTCLAITSQSCNVYNNCSPFGICSIHPGSQQYRCSCHPGYQGDGYNCAPLPSTTPDIAEQTTEYQEASSPSRNGSNAPVFQTCSGNLCWCPEGYLVDHESSYCKIGSEDASDDCRTLHNCDYNARCAFNVMLQGYICTCNEGFEGDGFTCREERSSCTESDNCGPHATCTYDESIGRSSCVCNAGYAGDGYSCAIAACSSNADCAHTEDCALQNGRYECVCKEGHSRDSQHVCVPLGNSCGGGVCVENAECLFDDDYQTNYCTCKPGYIGVGITECKERPVGCDTLNNCDMHATCQYDSQAFTYVCKCKPGFFGDGLVCNIEKNCLIDSSMCDINAQCNFDSRQKYVCQCNRGYVGNGVVCKEVSRDDGNFLLLNQGWATHRIPMEPNRRDPGKPIQIKNYQTAVGLDIDCLEGRFYWSDISLNAIRSARYNGTDITDFITFEIKSPEGLAIDWVSRNIYWTDSTLETIEVANLDSKRRRKLFSTGLENPRGIAVHPQRGKIFWSDWNRQHPKIEWANADGSDRRIFLEGKSVVLPNALAIDYDTEQLCYSDAGTKKIECVHIDTRQVQTIAVNCTYPFGIAVTDRLVYWSDWISKKIERVDKYTLIRLPSLNIPAGGSGNKLFGLAAVLSRCPSLSSICQYSRCPEEHICLPNGKGSKNCLCARSFNANEEPNCVI